jgi:hypothetical protein
MIKGIDEFSIGMGRIRVQMTDDMVSGFELDSDRVKYLKVEKILICIT